MSTRRGEGHYTGIAGEVVTFDGSASTDDVGIVTYEWNFGDGGTATGVNPTYVYAASGTYTVTLTVTDGDGATGTATASVEIGDVPPPANVAPLADPGGPYEVTIGESVQCDGSASADSDGTIVSYDWDFGDGNVGTGVSPSHTYAAVGTYTVSLTVTDNDGATGMAATTVTVAEVPPPAVLDLDIAALRVTKRIGMKRPKAVRIKLVVRNGGTVDGVAEANIVGMQNGQVVYDETLVVSDAVGNGRTTYLFPEFVPSEAGNITWIAVIADADADIDEAEATTRVVH